MGIPGPLSGPRRVAVRNVGPLDPLMGQGSTLDTNDLLDAKGCPGFVLPDQAGRRMGLEFSCDQEEDSSAPTLFSGLAQLILLGNKSRRSRNCPRLNGWNVNCGTSPLEVISSQDQLWREGIAHRRGGDDGVSEGRASNVEHFNYGLPNSLQGPVWSSSVYDML